MKIIVTTHELPLLWKGQLRVKSWKCLKNGSSKGAKSLFAMFRRKYEGISLLICEYDSVACVLRQEE